MDAGRELDALIAVTVMGLYAEDGTDLGGGPCESWYKPGAGRISSYGPPRYSTEISAAWNVVEKMAEDGLVISVCWGAMGTRGSRASVMRMGDEHGVSAETAPHAICLAALNGVTTKG